MISWSNESKSYVISFAIITMQNCKSPLFSAEHMKEYSAFLVVKRCNLCIQLLNLFRITSCFPKSDVLFMTLRSCVRIEESNSLLSLVFLFQCSRKNQNTVILLLLSNFLTCKETRNPLADNSQSLNKNQLEPLEDPISWEA